MLVNNNLPLQKKVDNLPTENSDNLVSSGGVYSALDNRGIPSGGTTGQVLEKLSDDDFDTGWRIPTGNVDLSNYVTTETFNNTIGDISTVLDAILGVTEEVT